MNKKLLIKLLSVILIMSMVMCRFIYTFADDDDLDAEDDGLDAITDYSTYGASDVFETSAANYLGSGFSDVKDTNLLGL